MQKIEKRNQKHFSGVRLYLDDVEEIINILKESGAVDIKLSTSDYEIKSDELTLLKEKCDKLNNLEISVHAPSYMWMTLGKSFGSRGVDIYYSDTTTAHGVVEKVKRLFVKRRRPIIFVVGNTYFPFIVYILSIAYLIVLDTLYSLEEFYNFWYGILTILFFGGLFILLTIQKNIIIFNKKSSRPNFFIRKKDDIIFFILSSLFGAFVYWLVQKII